MLLFYQLKLVIQLILYHIEMLHNWVHPKRNQVVQFLRASVSVSACGFMSKLNESRVENKMCKSLSHCRAEIKCIVFWKKKGTTNVIIKENIHKGW